MGGLGKVVTDCWYFLSLSFLVFQNSEDGNEDYNDDVNVDVDGEQVSPLGQDAVQLKVEDETESHAWFVQLYHDYVVQYCYDYDVQKCHDCDVHLCYDYDVQKCYDYHCYATNYDYVMCTNPGLLLQVPGTPTGCEGKQARNPQEGLWNISSNRSSQGLSQSLHFQDLQVITIISISKKAIVFHDHGGGFPKECV